MPQKKHMFSNRKLSSKQGRRFQIVEATFLETKNDNFHISWPIGQLVGWIVRWGAIHVAWAGNT